MVYSMSQWLDKQKEKERQISCLFAVIISVFCGHQDTQSLNKKKKKKHACPISILPLQDDMLSVFQAGEFFSYHTEMA